jgi:CRP-like cAMP-binding protein
VTERRLTADEWESVRELGRLVRYPDGHLVAAQGANDQSVYAVESGEVRITLGSADGSESVVGVRRAGELVGEMAPLDGMPRSASVMTRGPVHAWVLSGDRFKELLHRHPGLAFELLSVLARRLRELGDQHALRSQDLPARVAWRLRALVDASGSTELRITQKELADWVGATREGTARVLTDFRQNGLVHTGRGRIEVLNLAGLERYARD